MALDIGTRLGPYEVQAAIGAGGMARCIAPGNGQHVIFTDNTGGRLDDARVAVLALQSGQIRMLANGGTNPRYSPTGHVLFARGGGLYAVPFDAERAEATGPERLVLNGVNLLNEPTEPFEPREPREPTATVAD